MVARILWLSEFCKRSLLFRGNLLSFKASAKRMHIEEFRTGFQPHLDAWIGRKAGSYARYTGDPFLLSLFNYTGQLASGGGKRIRPYVAYLMWKSLADDCERDEKIIRFLVALELFHLFCLVHDDMIDRGTQRYDIPTVQRYVAGELRRRGQLGDHDHIGDSQALLLGDMLFSWSHEAMCDGDFSVEVRDAARHYFHLMIDVDMMTRRETSLHTIRQKMVLKTASYTFIRPMQIGASLAGANMNDASTRIENYCYQLGLALGLAFQTQDDLLDLIGTPDTTGKTLFADLRDGTHTLFTQYIFECGNEKERMELRQILGSNVGAEDRNRVLDLFQRSGALAHGRAQVEQYLQKSQNLIDSGPLCREARDGFNHLIEVLRQRDTHWRVEH
jgi:geranylgeranyl diphosphate synthase, type I